MAKNYEVQFKAVEVEAENYNEAAKKADKLRPNLEQHAILSIPHNNDE